MSGEPLDRIEHWLARGDQRFDAFEHWQQRADERFDAIEGWQRRADERFDAMDQRLDRMERRLDGLQTSVIDLQAAVVDLGHQMRVLHEDVISKLAAFPEQRWATQGELGGVREDFGARLDPLEVTVREHSRDIATLKKRRR